MCILQQAPNRPGVISFRSLKAPTDSSAYTEHLYLYTPGVFVFEISAFQAACAEMHDNKSKLHMVADSVAGLKYGDQVCQQRGDLLACATLYHSTLHP